MLENIKKIQGICNNDFDNIIENHIKAAKLDLDAIGIAVEISKAKDNDSLINTAIETYVLGFLDVNNSEMYMNSYQLQKDVLRHIKKYRNKDK